MLLTILIFHISSFLLLASTIDRFHLTQLLTEYDDNVTVAAVVEPYFLGAGKGKPGSEGFEAVMKENPSISFYASVEELPHCEIGSPHLFLIAGRTVDAQALFVAAIQAQVGAILPLVPCDALIITIQGRGVLYIAIVPLVPCSQQEWQQHVS